MTHRLSIAGTKLFSRHRSVTSATHRTRVYCLRNRPSSYAWSSSSMARKSPRRQPIHAIRARRPRCALRRWQGLVCGAFGAAASESHANGSAIPTHWQQQLVIDGIVYQQRKHDGAGFQRGTGHSSQTGVIAAKLNEHSLVKVMDARATWHLKIKTLKSGFLPTLGFPWVASTKPAPTK